MSKVASARSAEPGARMICACFDLTWADIDTFMARADTTVEGLIEETRIGTKCTACLLDLDLALNDIADSGDAAGAALSRSRRDWREVGAGRLIARDYLDSGFLIEDGGVWTELVCANYGQFFELGDSVATFDYTVRLFDENGRAAGRSRGSLGRGDCLRLRFGEIPGCPKRGWFLLRLKPRSFGLEGSIRPQLLLHGPNFTASVHTQPHWMACRGKAVMVAPVAAAWRTGISIVNASRRRTHVGFRLARPDAPDESAASLDLTGLGSCLVELDDLFDPPAPGAVYLLSVTSNRPTRKHVINRLDDGSLSIDHFPNSK